MSIGQMVRFEYKDGNVWEGSVEKIGVSKAGVAYFTLQTFLKDDVMGPVFRSFHMDGVISWK